MKVAVVHDWLYTYAGSERVLEQILRVFPQADLYSLIDFLPADQRGFLGGKPVTTSFIQRLPFAKSNHRRYLPLMPLAVEQFDLSAYNLVLSSSHAVAKGVITGPDQLHISYVHSPMRYAWDLQHSYLKEAGLKTGLKSGAARALLHYLRLWDLRTATGRPFFSQLALYRAARLEGLPARSNRHLPARRSCGLRAAPSKRGLLPHSFAAGELQKSGPRRRGVCTHPRTALGRHGHRPDLEKIRAKASPNVEVLGYQPFSVWKDYMQRARAFVFAAEEDFGIVPVEAQACGTPVIAYGKGGALETVVGLPAPNPTGVFFQSQDISSVLDAIATFEAHQAEFRPEVARARAERFGELRFRTELEAFVTAAYRAFEQKLAS